MMKHGSVEHYNEEAGIVWLNRLKNKFSDLVWLNPLAKEEWQWTRSVQMIEEFTENRMFPLTIRGIGEAVEALKS